MSQIAINEKVFESTVNQMIAAKTNLSAIKPMKFTPGHTNLKSVKEQLLVIRELYATLQIYCELLDYDFLKLQATGQEMVLQDKQISQSMRMSTL